jgi:hypothetical protein
MAELRRASDSPGELVYEGAVAHRDAEAPPLFRYERRVEGDGRSSHLTFAADGDLVLLHQAVHSPRYELLRFREVHAQTGLAGQVDVHADGSATFRTTVGGRTRSRVEAPRDPLQVGPTLFGYVLEHWDSLLSGNPLPLRFVVLDRRRSFRFELERVDGPPGTTCFEMSPTHPLVALVVPRAELVFDEDRSILRYSGLVPPREEVGGRLERLDATVTYEHVADRYR